MPRAGSDYCTFSLDGRVMLGGSYSVLKATERRQLFSVSAVLFVSFYTFVLKETNLSTVSRTRATAILRLN